MEEARIGVLKTCFESYTSIQVSSPHRSSFLVLTRQQKSLAPEVERIAENLRRDSSAINAKSDIGDFIREKKTGASKPARAEYEPYDPAVCLASCFIAKQIRPRLASLAHRRRVQ